LLSTAARWNRFRTFGSREEVTSEPRSRPRHHHPARSLGVRPRGPHGLLGRSIASTRADRRRTLLIDARTRGPRPGPRGRAPTQRSRRREKFATPMGRTGVQPYEPNLRRLELSGTSRRAGQSGRRSPLRLAVTPVTPGSSSLRKRLMFLGGGGRPSGILTPDERHLDARSHRPSGRQGV
jgi:hypothetical protein